MLNWQTLGRLDEDEDEEYNSNIRNNNVSKINWNTLGTEDIDIPDIKDIQPIKSDNIIQEQSTQQENTESNIKTTRENYRNFLNDRKTALKNIADERRKVVEKEKQLKEENEKNQETIKDNYNKDFRSQNPVTVTPTTKKESSINPNNISISLSDNNNTEVKELKKGDAFKLTEGLTDDRTRIQKLVDSAFGIGTNVLMGAESVIPSTVQYLNSGGEILSKEIGNELTKKIFKTDEKNSNLVGDVFFKKLWELSNIGKINKELNNDEITEWREKVVAENIKKTSTPLGKKIAEITPSVGQNLIPMAVSYFNPMAGTMLFMTSASGNYLTDAKSRGMNDEESFAYATVMGIFEGGTEEVISGKMLSNAVKLFNGVGLSKEILDSYGVSTVENFFQEAIMEPLQETTATIIGGKDKANWNNIAGRSLEAGLDGIYSAILLSGASLSIPSAINVLNKANPSELEIQKAISDTINSNKLDLDKIITGVKLGLEKSIVNNDGIGIFYTATFNRDGNIESINAVQGKAIDNPNKKLNISPVIVRNSNLNVYNVIDGNTGLLLDNRPYNSLIQAKAEFAHKIMNLDEASIKGINSKVGQANIAVNNKTAEVIRQAQEIVNSNNSQTSQDNRTQNLNNETSNYMSQTQNDVTSQNKTSESNPVNDITKLTEQISDTSVYKNENARDILNRVSQDIPNVEIIEQSGNTYINTLDSEGNVTYQQKVKNTPYTGKQLKSIINNVMENADMSINTILNIKQYTQNDIDRFSTNKNNLINKVNGNIETFVEEFYDYNTKKAKKKAFTPKNKKMFLGRISDNLANKINNLLNTSKMFSKVYDTTDTNVVISSNNIEHIYNYHGNEKRSGQLDVTPENLSKYGEVIFNPDYIGVSAQLSRGDTPVLYFSKKINGYSVAVEVLTNKKQLYPESYYIFRSNSKEYQDFIKNRGLKKAEDVESNDLMSSDSNAQGDTSVASIDTSIPQSKDKVKSSTNTNSMQNNENNVKGGNENVRQERPTYNGQETSRMQEGENTRGESQDARTNEVVREKRQKALSNYQKQQQKKLGKDFKATTVEKENQSKNEQIVSEGFKQATGLDFDVFETNKNTTEGAFYSNDSIFVKHNSLANKKATNFKPYHEFGHWLKNNKAEQWQSLYNIIDDSITKKQIEDYKNILNNKSIFDNMTEEETRDYIINEIISDYVGNWANDIMNWKSYIEQGLLNDEYKNLLGEIALEKESIGYNIFGSIEQQNSMNEAITEIMEDVIGKNDNIVSSNLSNEVVFSDRELQEYSEEAQKNINNLRKQLNKWINLQWKSDSSFDMGQTPSNLLLNNINIKSLPVVMEEKVLVKATGGKHSIAIDEISKIPGELEKPIIIMNGSVTDSYMILTNLLDKSGNNVWIALHFNRLEKRLKVNKIASMYAKDNIGNFLEKNIRENNILQVDSKRLQELITNRGLQLPKLVQSTLVNNSITLNNKNVNNNTVTTKSMQNNQNDTQKSDRIDLDNEKEQNYSQEQSELQRKQQEERRQVAKMLLERSFFKNVYNSEAPTEFKAELIKNRKDYQYKPVSNEETMEIVRKKVDNVIDETILEDEFLQLEKLDSAEDTAMGDLLIQKAIARGDYKKAQTLTASLAEKLTTAGQTIQAAAMFKRMTPDGMLLFAQRKINQINKELDKKFKLDKRLKGKEIPHIELTEDKVQFINNLMKQMEEFEKQKANVTDGTTMEIIDREQDVIIAKIVAKLGEDIPVTKLDKLSSWRNISLLLNSKTIKRNLVSNILFGTLENVSDALGVGIDKAMSLITGERSLLMPDLKTQTKGFKKGLKYAIEDTKLGISTSLGGNKYDIKPSKMFENRLLQKLETATYFGVEGLDRPFTQAKYESALQMIMKLEGMEYGKDIPTEDMKQEALESAKYTTFKDKNAISEILSNVKRGLNLNQSIGLADIIGLTYTNIPGNLTKKAIDYSPAGLWNIWKSYKNFKSAQIEGKNIRQAQRQLVQATSRVLIGSGILAVSIQAFLAGILTASGDDEDDKVKELVGKENYAINVSGFLRWISGGDTTPQNGDLYVTYSNYEPLSSIIASAAEMAGATKEGDGILTVAHKGLTTWINTIAELSTLSNFSSLFEYKNLGGNLTRSISEFPASFIQTV